MSGDKEGARKMWDKIVFLVPDYAKKESDLYQLLFTNEVNNKNR